MNILTKLGNGLDAFKSAFIGSRDVSYARLDDGTHAYNYETSLFDAMLGKIGIKNPYYTPAENYKYYYMACFFLADCIDLYADKCSQVQIVEVDKKGNEIESSKYVEFLNDPNPLQSLPELITEMVINALTTGISIQYGNFFKNGNLRLGGNLYNVDFNRLSMPKVKNPYLLNSRNIKDLPVVEELEGREKRDLIMADLAYYYDRVPKSGYAKEGFNSKNYFNPISRISPILSSIHTLVNSQDTMTFLTNNPVNSLITPDSNVGGVGGHKPLDGDQKKDAELKLSGKGPYGAGRGKIGDYIVTNQILKRVDLSRNNAKAQNIEMQDNAKDNVRTRFLIPEDYFGGSTYENKQYAESQFILGPAKALTDKFLHTLMHKSPEYFNNGNKLIGKYDHLASVIAGKNVEESKTGLDRAKTLSEIIKAFIEFKNIEPEITWDQFLIRHQFNELYKVK